MKNHDMAREYFRWANRCLAEASDAMADNFFPAVIRRSQEALELSLKAILRYFAIEFPREHDVSECIDLILDRLPAPSRDIMVQAKPLMSELAKKRGPAMYGLEEQGMPPGALFTKHEAERVFSAVSSIVLHCRAIVEAQT